MKIRRYYKGIEPKKKLSYVYDKKNKGRPAWIEVKGLPKGVKFISIHLGKKGKDGQRIQLYRTYLPEGLFLPLDYTKEEMEKFYDRYSRTYDKSLKDTNFNLNAAEFLLKKVKKYIRKGEMLDLGSGTGLITEIFVKSGFSPATLVDYSQGMLDKAKGKKILKGSKFIKQDIRKLKLNKKYDFILSFFSLGSSSYFNKEDKKTILNVVEKHLKKRGIIAVLGHTGNLLEKKFNIIEKGIYTLSEKNKFYTDYFIGRKK